MFFRLWAKYVRPECVFNRTKWVLFFWGHVEALSVSCRIKKLRDQNTGRQCLSCGMYYREAQYAFDAERTKTSDIKKRFLWTLYLLRKDLSRLFNHPVIIISGTGLDLMVRFLHHLHTKLPWSQLSKCRISSWAIPRVLSQAIHRGGPDWTSGRSVWDLWWTKCHLDKSPPSTSQLPCQYHCTSPP